MSETTEPTTIHDLRRRIEESRARLVGLLSHLDDDEVATVDPETGWAIKDHLVHMACWEVGIAAHLKGRNRWEAMGVADDAPNRLSMDELNELMCQQNRNLTSDDARVLFDGAYREMVNALEDLSDADLQRPYASFMGQDAGDDTRPIIHWIAGNTYGHYDEHSEWIAGYLARVGRSPRRG